MKTGLVLEGGGSRGAYTAGVLDVFKENGITFDYGAGTSVGSYTLAVFAEGNTERIKHIFMGGKETKYCGVGELLLHGTYMNVHKLYGKLLNTNPDFDYDAYFNNPMEKEYVATCCETGKAEYFVDNGDLDTFINIGKASCSLPILCKPFKMGDKYYMDGSLSDPLPVDRAFERGCDRVMVISTKGPGMEPSDLGKYGWFMKIIYPKKFAPFIEAIKCRIPLLMGQYDHVDELEAEGKVMMLHPRKTAIGHIEKDASKINELYLEGRQYALDNLSEIRDFLGIK